MTRRAALIYALGLATGIVMGASIDAMIMQTQPRPSLRIVFPAPPSPDRKA